MKPRNNCDFEEASDANDECRFVRCVAKAPTGKGTHLSNRSRSALLRGEPIGRTLGRFSKATEDVVSTIPTLI